MNTRYVIIFILIMTTVVALLLTGLQQATKSQALINEDIFNKRAILSAVESHIGDGKKVSDLSDDDVLGIFKNKMEQIVLDADGNVQDGMMAENIDMAKEKKKPEDSRLYPLYVYNAGKDKFYILSVRGKGLWDEIWGNIALESDLNTITGAAFDHKGETPGLGAEIKDNKAFPAQFKGTKIYDEDGDYVSVTVRKGGAKDKMHEVDGISGATVTADGVTDMLYKGIKRYQPYFEKVKSKGNTVGMLSE